MKILRTSEDLLQEIEKHGIIRPDEFRGAAFPSVVWDGRSWYHTTHHTAYHYDAGKSRWLSDCLYGPFYFGHAGDQTVTLSAIAINMVTAGSGTRTFNATRGYMLDFDCVVAGMTADMDTSGTATYGVCSNTVTAPVAGATLALSSQKTKSDFTILSNVISANSYMTVVLSSGTGEAPMVGAFWVRRAESP